MGKRSLNLADDKMCFGCGSRNAHGLKLKFVVDEEQQMIQTRWTPTKKHQGYVNILHGGIMALVLDEMMGNLLWKLKKPAVTAELTVRFHRPAYVGKPISCEAYIKQEQGRLFWMEAKAEDLTGRIVATATAKCVTAKR